MRVISRKRLREFWQRHAGSQAPLEDWHRVASRAVWRSFQDVRATYRSADVVGDCVVFNIGGNRFRLIARLRYPTQKLFVLKIMTHAEYSKNRWPAECGCFGPPAAPE